MAFKQDLELPAFLTVHTSPALFYFSSDACLVFLNESIQSQGAKLGSPIQPSAVPVNLVIVVDADPDMTEVLSNVLKSNEWDVAHAADNQIISKLTEKAHFDPIITGAESIDREDVD